MARIIGEAIYENRQDHVSIRVDGTGDVLIYSKGQLVTVLALEKLRNLVQLAEQTKRRRRGLEFPQGPPGIF